MPLANVNISSPAQSKFSFNSVSNSGKKMLLWPIIKITKYHNDKLKYVLCRNPSKLLDLVLYKYQIMRLKSSIMIQQMIIIQGYQVFLYLQYIMESDFSAKQVVS